MSTNEKRLVGWSMASLLLVTSLVWAATSDKSAPPSAQTQPVGNKGARAMPIPPGVDAWRDVEYAKVGDKSLRLDLYVPKETKDLPSLVVWIHGGAWTSGDKAGGPAMGLLGSGYAVASINYRFSQEAIYPAQIEDCKAAIRWLRAHAGQYHYDPRRIGVWGSSAGGHLVALLGTSGGAKELEGSVGNLDQSSQVQAVCDWFGPTDFTTLAQPAGQEKQVANPHSAIAIVTQLFGGPVAERMELARLASPITFVSKDAPPFLIMHGDQDRTVPLQQSVLLHEALKKAGVTTELVVVPGAGHGFPGPESVLKVKAFFDRTLKGEATASQPVTATKP